MPFIRPFPVPMFHDHDPEAEMAEQLAEMNEEIATAQNLCQALCEYLTLSQRRAIRYLTRDRSKDNEARRIYQEQQMVRLREELDQADAAIEQGRAQLAGLPDELRPAMEFALLSLLQRNRDHIAQELSYHTPKGAPPSHGDSVQNL